MGAPSGSRRRARATIAATTSRSALRERLTGDAVRYLVGEVASRLLTFAILIVLANVVSAAEFGYTSLYFGLANLAAIPIGLGLPGAVLRYRFVDVPYRAVIGSTVVLVAVATAVGVAMILAAANPLADVLAISVPLLSICLAGGVAIAFRTVWTTSLRARQQSATYGAVLIVEPVLGAAFVVAWAMIGGRLDAISIAACFASGAALVAAVSLIRLAIDPGWQWDPRLARELLAFSLPLIVHAFAMLALGTFDQTVINQTLGPGEAGRYAFAYRWGMAMVALTAAVGAMWGPRLLELVRDDAGRSRLDGLATRMIGGLVVASIGLMIVVPAAARIVAPPAFRSALWLTPWITYGYLWFALYSNVSAYAIAFHRTRRIALASLSVMVATTAANYVLVPRLGIAIAAFTTIAAFIALFFVQWWVVRDVAVDVRYRRLIGMVVAAGIVPVLATVVLA
jgi:O-antigen/teichoic acid export membrane protein